MLVRRLAAVALAAFSTLANAQDATSTAGQAANHCYELPVIVVTALDESFPDATCNQLRYPAADCLKASVRTRVEVIDGGGGSANTFAASSTSERAALNCFDPAARNASSVAHAFEATSNYRGQTSLFFPKHQLSVQFAAPTALLGFPEDTAFVLNGPYLDCSLLRNHLAHWLFRATGRYSPRTRHAAVYFQPSAAPDAPPAQYVGVYLLLEKLSYGRHRVNLSPLGDCAAGDGDGDSDGLSGGWAWQNDPLSFGAYSPNVVVDEYQNEFGMGERPLLAHPPGHSLTQRQRDHFVNTSTGFLPRFYRALWHNLSSAEELERHADLGSFADYLLHTEMSLNVDAYRRSTFFFKDWGQPINAGPVWDLNLAYGNGARRGFQDWIFPQYTFWKRLMCNHKLAALVIQRWRALRGSDSAKAVDAKAEDGASGVWSDEAIAGFLDASAAPMARQMAKCRAQGGDWRGDVRQCASVSLIECNGTYAEQVDALKAAVLARARWMDAHVAELFKPLDAGTCSGVGDVPRFNCAADGDDDGCLADPEAYYSRVAFPPVRKGRGESAEAGGEAAKALCARESLAEAADASAYDAPSEDDCWRSAGLYVYPEQKGVRDKSLTFFCNGYGSCPEGPGAVCTCSQGVLVEDKTCRRIDAETVVRKATPARVVAAVESAKRAAAAGSASSFSPGAAAGAAVALVALASAGAGVALVTRQMQRRRRRRREQLNEFRPVSYGSAQDYDAFVHAAPAI